MIPRLAHLFAAFLCITIPPAFAGAKVEPVSPSEPAITQIKGRRITVNIPAGFERVTLQALTAPRRGIKANSPRAQRAEWKTVGIQYPGTAETTVTFRVDRLTPRRHLRVFGERKAELSGELLTGISSFLPDRPEEEITPFTLNLSSGRDGITTVASMGSISDASTNTSEPRVVVESDIWKHHGDRLYFFNERRGLQSFDISNPDAPALLGTLRMPGLGEDMYLLDDDHVVLLKKSWTWFWAFDNWTTPIIRLPILLGGAAGDGFGTTFAIDSGAGLRTDSSNTSVELTPERETRSSREIVVANVKAGQPKIVGRVSYEGHLMESRLIGDMLYLAVQNSRAAKDGELALFGTDLCSYDLSDPVNPTLRNTLRLPGSAHAIMATDQNIFVSGYSEDYRYNAVRIVDISNLSGEMSLRGEATVEGYVGDKFKMHSEDGVLTVVSAGWRTNFNRTVSITHVSTFALAGTGAPAALDSIELAPNETVRATRFDNGRAYVVTFVQIDPLWVIDLRKPSKLEVLGHVEAPGFSTYIEPLGDRLVTIGYVNWRPAVSLFAVNNSGTPSLLTQIELGGDAYSWSEAASNEKAFSVLPEQNLVMLPLHKFDGAGGSSGGVQLVDLFRNKLVKRGIAREDFVPRRATVHRDRILSISPRYLTTIDASDRSQPELVNRLEIAWTTNRLFVVGDHLIHLGTEWSNDGQDTEVTISPAGTADETLSRVALPAVPIVGAAVRDGLLHVLQIVRAYDLHFDVNTSSGGSRLHPQNEVILSTFDVSALPAITSLGRATVTAAELSSGYYYNDLKPLWINEHTLAFSLPVYGARTWYRPIWTDPQPYRIAKQVWVADSNTTGRYETVEEIHYEPGYWYRKWTANTSQTILAFDVSKAAKPKLASILRLGEDKPWVVAPPVAVDGGLYASYRSLGGEELLADWDSAVVNDPDAYKPIDPSSRGNRHYLKTIDYADPTVPVIEDREPNLPGKLVATGSSGDILFTTGQLHELATNSADANQKVLHASALQGNVVHLLDQLPLSEQTQPIRFETDHLFVFEAQPRNAWVPFGGKTSNFEAVRAIWPPQWGWKDNPKKSRLTAWELGVNGKFSEMDTLELEHETAFGLYENLGVIFEQANEPEFLDLSSPRDLQSLGFHSLEAGPVLNYEHADGSLSRGLWIPAGIYGAESIIFGK